MKKISKQIICLLFIMLLLLAPNVNTNTTYSFSPQVIQHGAVGEDVIELQSRLQYIGFYNGKIDGMLGWGTYWSVRNFEYEFGVDIDEMAGETTKNKLR